VVAGDVLRITEHFSPLNRQPHLNGITYSVRSSQKTRRFYIANTKLFLLFRTDRCVLWDTHGVSLLVSAVF